MIKSLIALEDFLVQSNYEIIKRFNAGKPDDEIVSMFDSLKLPLRSDVLQLYNWRNGIEDIYGNEIGRSELFGTGIMFPLEYAVSSYAAEAKSLKSFSKYFFPLFTSGGRDYILINLEEKSETFGQLFLYSLSILTSDKPMSIYDSLESLFETVLEIYKAGGYSFPNGALEIEYDIESEISARLNPKSKYWLEN